MSKKYCKEGCEFLKSEFGKYRCIIYKRPIEVDKSDRCLRLKKCVRESRDFKISAQIDDIHTFYDSFVCEMDVMFDKLHKLMKGEK